MEVHRLRAIRLRRLLTQEDLAKKAGVGLSTIIRLEQGEKGRISSVRKLAEALDVTPDELLSEDQAPGQQEAA